MQRIATATKAIDLYGIGKHGFRDGNLALGITPTDLEAAWVNGVQEELISVIEAAGIAPAAGTLNQLLLALRSVGVFQTQAIGDASTKVATTAFANPGSSLSANGWHKWPSGLILQWGFSTGFTTGDTAVTFPIAFTTAIYGVFPTVTNSGGGSGWASSNSQTLTGCNLASFNAASIRAVYNLGWFALGK